MKIDYEISVNESFQLALESNPTTGYAWKWVNKESVSIVDTFNCSFVLDSPKTMGSGGKEIWNFKGILSGIDTIQLDYCRPWDSNSLIKTKKIVVKVK